MMLRWFVCGVALLLPSAVSVELSSFMTNIELPGLPGVTKLQTLHAPSEITCAVLCLAMDACSWYTQDQGTYICTLFREYHPADITPNSFDQDFNDTLFGVNREMRCSPPTSIVNGAVHAATRGEGDVAHYACDADYTFCRGVTNTSVCSASGQWQGIPGECVRNRWKDLSGNGVYRYLPCPLGIGDRITWTGIPTSEYVFNVDLHGPFGRPLHIHVRFNYYSYHNITAIAHLTNDNWITGGHYTYFPFEVGKLFRIVVVMEDTLFRIYIDDQELGTLDYGSGPAPPQIDFLGFEQEVDARSAEIDYV
ncbi:uncharacterized protein LOC124140591 [Haliotis rufescens]|uniref:uncharacterized protein LOC124140591 n=1 Tax=Haliotis rufescens TaxID=6454 RepID=UPI00201F89C3|nr:uncharacterized protein LOC124140591 [Haliotis rufescens]